MKGEFGVVRRWNTFMLGVNKPYMLWGDYVTSSEIEMYLRVQGPLVVSIYTSQNSYFYQGGDYFFKDDCT